MPEDRAPRYLGLAHGYDIKPKRRQVDILRSQDSQANQDITFLIDGDNEIRALAELISPCGEHVLDCSTLPCGRPCSGSTPNAWRSLISKRALGSSSNSSALNGSSGTVTFTASLR